MPRILVTESHPDVRRMFEYMLRRLGHDPVVVETLTEPVAASIDVVAVEPADAASVELAAAARRLNPDAGVIAVTILPRSRADSVPPREWLLKPFTLEELRAAIDHALA